eukprot:3017410-Amphidinium_carterae.1
MVISSCGMRHAQGASLSQPLAHECIVNVSLKILHSSVVGALGARHPAPDHHTNEDEKIQLSAALSCG